MQGHRESLPQVDLTGQMFGCMTVVGFVEMRRWTRGMAAYFKCRCTCGHESVVQRSNIRAFGTSRKVCPHRRRLAPDGFHSHPLRKVYGHMRDRCENPRSRSFKDYGARGIAVCKRWVVGDGVMSGFECFIGDMGPRPAGGTIERLDVSSGYSPQNCVWIPKAAQALNTRRNIHVTIGGRKLTVSEWARLKGINQFTVYMRIRKGWDPVRAVTEPVRKASIP